MKVLYVSEGYLDRPDGSTVHIKGLIGGLGAAGVEVKAILRKDDGTGALEVPEIEIPGLGTVMSQKRMETAVFEIARRWKPDVILGRVEYQTLAAPRVAELLRLPLVADLNGDLAFQLRDRPWQQRVLCRFSERRFLYRARSIVVTSAGVAEAVAARTGIARSKFRVLPMGIDERFFEAPSLEEARARLGLDPASRIALFIGHINRWQGLEDLLAAAEHLRTTGIRIVGDGPARAEYEQAARGLPLTFAGPAPLERVPLLLAAADVLLQPRRHPDHKGMPTRVAEYLASGRPLLAATTHETERELAGQGCLVAADYADPRSTALAIERLAAGDDEGRAAALKGRAHAAERLTWKAIGEELRGILTAS